MRIRDREQLDRIERKLDWLRWRLRWGEIGRIVTTSDPFNMQMIPADIGPDPGWPEA